jgi:hypothetical protein
MGQKLHETGGKTIVEYTVVETTHPRTGKVTKVPRRRRRIWMSIWRG